MFEWPFIASNYLGKISKAEKATQRPAKARLKSIVIHDASNLPFRIDLTDKTLNLKV